MATQETNITNEILLAMSKMGVVLFRNVRGFFWTQDKSRQIKAGLLCKGSSDLIGYVPTLITEEHLGKTLSIFCALEIKTATGRPSSEQLEFIDRVKSRGGKAGIARSVEDALKIIK